eukprot:10324545-Ditylum_brightwellii.AAC.1
MKYYIDISYRIDQKSIKNTNSTPIYGMGQGAMDAPPSLTLLFNICQKAYKRMQKAVKYMIPLDRYYSTPMEKCLMMTRISYIMEER